MKTAVRRGDIYYADLNPSVGCEQGGIRPVVIIQNDVGNHYSPTVIAAAITSQQNKHNLPTHICISGGAFGLRDKTLILLEQVRTLDRQRLRRYIGHFGAAVMQQVDAALAISLGLSEKIQFENDEEPNYEKAAPAMLQGLG